VELPWNCMYLGESEVVRISRLMRWSPVSLNSTMTSLKGNYKWSHVASITFPVCFQSHVLALFSFDFKTKK
jgi:hypothetical protein